MRAALTTGFCLVATLSYVLPVSASELLALSMPADQVMSAPAATPEALVAAQAAKTLEAVAAMHTRLAEIVPMQPRNDAVAQSAAAFSAHWGEAVTQYTNTQMQLVDTLIINVQGQHQTQISDFLNADHLVPELSLFADPMFTNPLEMPISFSNPPLIDAGFFGS
jgi:hypothetical protein